MFRLFCPLMLRNADPFATDGGGAPPASNPALDALTDTGPTPAEKAGIPVTDAGDEFAGDADLDGGDLPDDGSEQGEAPAGGEPAAPELGAAAPDALPGEDEFEAWAAKDPAAAQAFMDWQEAQARAAEAAAAPGDAVSGFADPDEQAFNVTQHIHSSDQEYRTAATRHNGEVDEYEQAEKEYAEGLAEDPEAANTTIMRRLRQTLDKDKARLSQQGRQLATFKRELDAVEVANSNVDKLPKVFGPYRELYVELFSAGRMNGAKTLEAQRSVLNAELASRGMALMGQKASGKAAKEASPLVKRFRALRSGTAPHIHQHSATSPQAPVGAPRGNGSAAAPGKDQLHPAMRAAVNRIKAK